MPTAYPQNKYAPSFVVVVVLGGGGIIKHEHTLIACPFFSVNWPGKANLEVPRGNFRSRLQPPMSQS